MTRQSDFDQALATLKPAIDQVKSDTDALLAKASASGVDLTGEQESLQASLNELSALHTEVSGTAAPAPSPAPANTPSAPPTNAPSAPSSPAGS